MADSFSDPRLRLQIDQFLFVQRRAPIIVRSDQATVGRGISERWIIDVDAGARGRPDRANHEPLRRSTAHDEARGERFLAGWEFGARGDVPHASRGRDDVNREALRNWAGAIEIVSGHGDLARADLERVHQEIAFARDCGGNARIAARGGVSERRGGNEFRNEDEVFVFHRIRGNVVPHRKLVKRRTDVDLWQRGDGIGDRHAIAGHVTESGEGTVLDIESDVVSLRVVKMPVVV